MKMKWLAVISLCAVLFSACSTNSNTPAISSGSGNSGNTGSISSASAESAAESFAPEEWENPVTQPISSFMDIDAGASYVLREGIEPVDTIEVAGELPLPLVTNETPLTETVSVIDGLTIIPGEIWNTVYHERGVLIPSASMENSAIPVSFLRRRDDGSFYTVVKLKDGGYGYFFYERPKNYATLEYITDDYTEAYLYGCVYMEKALYKSSFDALQPGDSIDSVIAIDNAARMTDQWRKWNEEITGEKFGDHCSIHLLKDGLLSIQYGYNDAGEYVIQEIRFSDAYIFHSFCFDEYPYPKDFSILPQDYPPES